MNVDGSCVTWSLMLMLSNSNAVLTVSMTAVSVEPEGLNKLVFIYVVFFVPLINKDNLNIIFTGRNEVVAKVMFLLVSVISVHVGGGESVSKRPLMPRRPPVKENHQEEPPAKETSPAKETPSWKVSRPPGRRPPPSGDPLEGDPPRKHPHAKETPRRRPPRKETPQPLPYCQ